MFFSVVEQAPKRKQDVIKKLNENTKKVTSFINSCRISNQFIGNDKFMISFVFGKAITWYKDDDFPFKDDLQVKDAIEKFEAAMRDSIDFIENVRNNNHTLAQNINVRDEMLKNIKIDDQIRLQNLVEILDRSKDIREDLNYALRNAANFGAEKCLSYLLNNRLVNILSPGPKSKEIALHAAIRNKHISCITKLLQAVTIMDYFALDKQLLFSKAAKRPIDLVKDIEDSNQRLAVIEAIHDVLHRHPAGFDVSYAARTEIDQILSESYFQHVYK